MVMRILQSLPFVAALLLLPAALCAQKTKDTILRKDGSRLRGVEIVDMDTQKVVFKRGAEQQELLASLVAGIEWGEPPETFRTGAAAEAKGEFDNAANLYQEAAKNTERKPLQAEARFLATRALVGAAARQKDRAAAAVDALKAFLKDYPTAWRLPEAKFLLGRALRLDGKAAEAEAALTEVETTAVKENWGVQWDARAKFEKALAQASQGKQSDARSAFQAVQGAVDAAVAQVGKPDSDLERLKVEALIGAGETFVAENRLQDATDYWNRIGGTDKPAAIQAAALAGKGQALYLRAKAAKDEKLLREAQIALAQANLLDGSNGDATAKALYHLGLVVKALGPAKEGDGAGQRARAYFEIVTRRHPQSAWARLAQAEIDAK